MVPVSAQVERTVRRLQLRDDVDEESMAQLTYHRLRAPDENLLRPPVVLGHVIQEPLNVAKQTCQSITEHVTIYQHNPQQRKKHI